MDIHPIAGVEALKAEARDLRAAREAEGRPTTHSEALELVAQRHGARNWNTLRAQAARPVRLTVGARLAGRYLGQPFAGRVHDVQPSGPGLARVAVQFDAPVDVVRSESFSSFRRRVTCELGRDGTSPARTSDGAPHMVVERGDGQGGRS